jgi:SAM-dependent methyltransferase
MAALELCRGGVLVVGAGAGCHALALQARGLEVCAIDLAPHAVEVMRRRGVADPRRAGVADLEAPPFDTVLLMMNGIGMAARVAALPAFLKSLGRLVRPDGQVVLDSFDPRTQGERAARAAGAGGYPGELRFRLEYKGRLGPWYAWLFVDFDTLARQAARAGWGSETVWVEEDGQYLARLWPAKPSAAKASREPRNPSRSRAGECGGGRLRGSVRKARP